MHPLDELKAIAKRQKTVRTTRLNKLVDNLNKSFMTLNKKCIEQKKANEKLQRDFQKVRDLADKRKRIAVEHEELKKAYSRLLKEKHENRA